MIILTKKILLLIFSLVLILFLTGCTDKAGAATTEEILKEQAEGDKQRKELADKASSKIVENMKKNSEKTINEVAAFNNNASSSIKYAKTVEELIDVPTMSFTNILTYLIFVFFHKLQITAIWWCSGLSALGMLGARIFHDDRPKLKKCYITIALGPILFLTLTYGPAFYWYLIK